MHTRITFNSVSAATASVGEFSDYIIVIFLKNTLDTIGWIRNEAQTNGHSDLFWKTAENDR